MRADNTRHLTAAARERARQTRERAVNALQRLDAADMPITFQTVARAGAVSRSWLYGQPDLRSEIQRRGPAASPAQPAGIKQRQRASETSLLRRLEASTLRLRHLEEDNRQLRQALAQALGARRADQILRGPPAATRPGDTTEEQSDTAPRHLPTVPSRTLSTRQTT